MVEYLDTQSEIFDDIVEDIKQRNLSRNNMPKLIIGTGLSIVYKIPGMKDLAEFLNEEINKSDDDKVKEMWNNRYPVIEEKALEAGLANLTQEEAILVETIKTLTALFILDSEEKEHRTIWERDTGFSKLLDYLNGTVGANYKVIDIMTPNYDRIIETVCDKLEIGVITGFLGNIYGRYHSGILRKPDDRYNCKNCSWVRLFKPHGSINWVNENGNEYLINDDRVLREKAEYIEIVAPGSSKYREGFVNNTYREMREAFNELLDQKNNYSLLFYGYGFNDDHFDTVFFQSFKRNVLILAREVKTEIIDKALKAKNITIFYHEDGKEYMIYKSKKYVMDLPLWDINQFADVFFA